MVGIRHHLVLNGCSPPTDGVGTTDLGWSTHHHWNRKVHPSEWFHSSSHEWRIGFLGTTQPSVTSGSEIDIGDFVPLASNPLCPFSGTPLPGPGVVKVDGSSVLTVDQNSAVTVRNGTFNVTSSGTANFVDARLDVYQVGLVVAELSSTVNLQHSNFSVSESGNVLIQGSSKFNSFRNRNWT